MHPYETFEHAGLTVTIHYDDSPSDPRKEFDHLGTLVLQPRRTYGRWDSIIEGPYGMTDWRDWHFTYDPDDDGLGEILNAPGTVALALSYHERDGEVTGYPVTGTDGDDQYDHDGYIYITRERWQSEMYWKRLTAKRREQLIQALKYELAELSAYHAGEVYGFTVEDDDGEHLDSCWGYYGPDIDYCRESAREAAEAAAADREEAARKDREAFAEALAQFESAAA